MPSVDWLLKLKGALPFRSSLHGEQGKVGGLRGEAPRARLATVNLTVIVASKPGSLSWSV